MLNERYFQSLSLELKALKDRVRNVIQDRHWLTDGEWKESVVRAFLRRHLPSSVEVGRGFVITERAPSKQIDVLIYDSTKPVLFRDGDLVFVTPDAVLGAIEVKSALNNSTFRTSVRRLCQNSELIQSSSAGRRVFGLFAFEDERTDIEQALEALQAAVGGKSRRVIHCICLGESTFIRFWDNDPVLGNRPLDKWYAYNLRRKAAGYFIHNIVEQICPQSVHENRALWYPSRGKERNRRAEIDLKRA